MAIDGTKIIDSDLAHDVYNEFMDLYDANTEIAAIKNKIEIWREQDLDETEHEIFITSYALALWETGNLTSEIFDETRQTIDKDAGVKMWREESGEIDAKNRSKELEKFIIKISTPKSKSRKRKKYKKIERFLFQPTDLITFQVSDDTYRAAILINIFQYRGDCIYQFTATSYMNAEKPAESIVEECSIFINKMACSPNNETLKKQQLESQSLSDSFIISLVLTCIEHQDLIKFKDKFEVIGKVKIKKAYNEIGSISYEDTFEKLAERYENIVERQTKNFKFEMVKLSRLIEKNL